jgi:hypothetical protein
MSPWRHWIIPGWLCCVFLLPALHGAFWRRAGALGGLWRHLDEAAPWFQTFDLTSLLVILCSLFGVALEEMGRHGLRCRVIRANLHVCNGPLRAEMLGERPYLRAIRT